MTSILKVNRNKKLREPEPKIISVEHLYHETKSLKDICTGLKQNSYYSVYIQLYPNNVRHKGILFTGFYTGSYRQLFNSTYILSNNEVLTQQDTIHIEVIKHIKELDHELDLETGNHIE